MCFLEASALHVAHLHARSSGCSSALAERRRSTRSMRLPLAFIRQRRRTSTRPGSWGTRLCAMWSLSRQTQTAPAAQQPRPSLSGACMRALPLALCCCLIHRMLTSHRQPAKLPTIASLPLLPHSLKNTPPRAGTTGPYNVTVFNDVEAGLRVSDNSTCAAVGLDTSSQGSWLCTSITWLLRCPGVAPQPLYNKRSPENKIVVDIGIAVGPGAIGRGYDHTIDTAGVAAGAAITCGLDVEATDRNGATSKATTTITIRRAADAVGGRAFVAVSMGACRTQKGGLAPVFGLRLFAGGIGGAPPAALVSTREPTCAASLPFAASRKRLRQQLAPTPRPWLTATRPRCTSKVDAHGATIVRMIGC